MLTGASVLGICWASYPLLCNLAIWHLMQADATAGSLASPQPPICNCFCCQTKLVEHRLGCRAVLACRQSLQTAQVSTKPARCGLEVADNNLRMIYAHLFKHVTEAPVPCCPGVNVLQGEAHPESLVAVLCTAPLCLQEQPASEHEKSSMPP